MSDLGMKQSCSRDFSGVLLLLNVFFAAELFND